jgi:malate dehydrogenase (oxaloacetate-decarboxylating)(NADP+)
MTRNYTVSLENINRVIDTKPGEFLFGISMVVAKGKTLFFSDTSVQELPTPEQLAHIAVCTAKKARKMGHEPRVALLSYSTFGNPMREKSARIRDAVKVLDSMHVDFEYDGEMSASVALSKENMSLYPFCRLSDTANVLVMPALHTAHVAAHLMQELGDGVTIGPILMGLTRPAQIVQMNASVSEIINLAALAAMGAIEEQESRIRPASVKGRKTKG